MSDTTRGGRYRLTRLLAPHRPLLALILLAACLYLPSIWTRDVWSPDEPRYAEVARAMVARGDYILPHLNGEVYGEKPPLYFWLGILAGWLPAVPAEAGTRLVSALAALGTLILTYRLGRRLDDGRTGWLAALVLATSAMFVAHATAGVIDGTLTFLVVAAIVAGLRARDSGSTVMWVVFYLLAGVAILTKGPVGIVIPAGVLFLLSLIEDGPGRSLAWHAGWGTAVAAGVVALWLVPAIARGGTAYADVILFKQNLGRAYQSWHHREPITYFLSAFPASFLPWIVLLPTALYGAAREAKRARLPRLALVWFVFTFVFFSLVSGKKTRYLLPLFPAASLLVALELRRLFDAARAAAAARLRSVLPLAAAALLLAGLGVAIAILPFTYGPGLLARYTGLAPDQHEALARLLRMPGALTLLLPGIAAAALGVAGLASSSRPSRSFACSAAAVLVAIGWAQWIATPAFNAIKSARPLAETVRRAAGPGVAIVMYRENWAGVFNLFLERETLPEISGLDRVVDLVRENPGTILLASPEDLGRLEQAMPRMEVIECRRVGELHVCVLGDRAGPG